MSGLDIVVTHRVDLSDATLAVLARLLDAWAARPSLPHTAMADVARDTAAQTAPAAMDWDAAIQWAQANNVAVDIRASTRVVERTINAARANHQLKPWVIVPTRTVMAPLPPPHLGAKYDGVHA